jgi:AraC-like DNA-binding protein
MIFKRIHPSPHAIQWVECYWIVENNDPTPVQQKIIPDGFPEIIFHFADPYRINLANGWNVQGHSLLAGQITKYFFLENSGRASILGIKLKPTALTHLFGLQMDRFNDDVVDLSSFSCGALNELEEAVRRQADNESRIAVCEDFFSKFSVADKTKVDEAVSMIMSAQGARPVMEISRRLEISERQLERLFKKYVGLSPKFYSRIIRLGKIFQLYEKGDPGWAALAYEGGYADQSHFIRNFKAFTGQDPSLYGFDEKNMANFFLRK